MGIRKLIEPKCVAYDIEKKVKYIYCCYTYCYCLYNRPTYFYTILALVCVLVLKRYVDKVYKGCQKLIEFQLIAIICNQLIDWTKHQLKLIDWAKLPISIN